LPDLSSSLASAYNLSADQPLVSSFFSPSEPQPDSTKASAITASVRIFFIMGQGACAENSVH